MAGKRSKRASQSRIGGEVERDPDAGGPKISGTRVHGYDAATAASWAFSAASASLAAAVLAWRLVLAEPVPIPMSCTVEIQRWHDH